MQMLEAVGLAMLAAAAAAPAKNGVNQETTIAGTGWSLPATLLLPASGPAPCVVFFAGSGPTDRDWKSPMLPGTNGSAKQLALALQAKGVGSIRFDKVGSGVNMPKSQAPEEMKKLAVLSMAHYVDEATAAFALLSKREECGKIFFLGHSEGSIHSFSAAAAKQADPRFGGMISMSGPSRSLLDTAISQIRAMHEKSGDDLAEVDAALKGFRAAMLKADAPPPDLTLIPEAASLWAPAHSPVQQKVVRELMMADPLVSVKAYKGRALVISAANDVQVPKSDGDKIFATLPGDAKSKTRVEIASANHVYKKEPRSPATTNAQELAIAYTEEGRPLADGLVDAIVSFVTAK